LLFISTGATARKQGKYKICVFVVIYVHILLLSQFYITAIVNDFFILNTDSCRIGISWQLLTGAKTCCNSPPDGRREIMLKLMAHKY